MGKFKSKISTGLAALLSFTALVFAGPAISAEAGSQLVAGGLKVSWNKAEVYPDVCKIIQFQVKNTSGKEIFNAGLVLTDIYGGVVFHSQYQQLPADFASVWTPQICPSFLKMGVGPYKLKLYADDNPTQDLPKSAESQIDFSFDPTGLSAHRPVWPLPDRQPTRSINQNPVSSYAVESLTGGYLYLPDTCSYMELMALNMGSLRQEYPLIVAVRNSKGVDLFRKTISNMGSFGHYRLTFPICKEDILGANLSLDVHYVNSAGHVIQSNSTIYFVPRPRPFVVEGESPTLKGEVRVGSTLNLSLSGWSGDAKYLVKYFRDGTEVQRSSGLTYVLTARDLGAAIHAEGQAYGDVYSAVIFKTPQTAPIQLGLISESPTPRIMGVTKVGKKLVVTTGTWEPGVKKAIQWLRSGQPIAGATASSYLISSNDKGKQISVRVIGDKDGYESKTVVSAKTGKVG